MSLAAPQEHDTPMATESAPPKRRLRWGVICLFLAVVAAAAAFLRGPRGSLPGDARSTS